jgi:Domain of unknown function (DUF4340)
MTSLQKILAIVLALQVILAGIIFWSQRPVSVESGPLLNDFEAENVAALTIENGEGDSVELAKLDGAWVLSSGGDYPADQEAVSTLLDELAAIQTDRLVTRTKDSHKRLQVAADDFNRRVQLELDDGTTVELFLGTSPNPRSIHARLADQNDVFLTGEVLSQEVNAVVSNWIDPTYVNLDREQVSTMTLTNANGTFELQKTDDEWALLGLEEGEELDPTGVNTLLDQLANLRMATPLGTEEQPEYGLDDPLALLTVTTEDDAGAERSYTLTVGAHDPESDTYAVKWSGSDYYVTVARFSGDRLIEITRDDFIAAPPAVETPPAE